MADHRLFGCVLVAAASHLSALLTCARQHMNSTATRLLDVVFIKPMVLRENQQLNVQVIIKDGVEKNASSELVSFAPDDASGEQAILHVAARLSATAQPAEPAFNARAIRESVQRRFFNAVSGAEFYRTVGTGFEFGDLFKRMNVAWVGDDEAVCEISPVRTIMERDAECLRYEIYPGMLDACFQLVGSLMNRRIDNEQETFVPFSINEFNFTHALAQDLPLWCHVKLRDPAQGGSSMRGDLVLWQGDSAIIASIKGFEFKKIRNEAMRASLGLAKARDFYAVQWHAQPLPANSSVTVMPLWVIFADQGNLANDLVERIQQKGKRAILVWQGSGFARKNGGYTVAPHSKQDFLSLTQAIADDFGANDAVVGHTVYLWALCQNSIEGGLTDLCVGLMHWLQALENSRLASDDQSNRVSLVTRQAHKPGSADLMGGALWGFGNALRLERPDLHCINVEFMGEVNDPRDLNNLWRELTTHDAEMRVRLEQGGRSVARLQAIKYEYASLPALRIQGDRTYLLTGALGGLGQSLLPWLVAQGARHFMLPVHRALKPQEQLWLDSLGVRIRVLKLDLTTAAGATILSEALQALDLPLAGVFHLAGRLQDQTLDLLDSASFADVIAPKAIAAWHLTRVLRALPNRQALEFVLLFSSAAAILGSAGQINYASANAFLDRLAEVERAHDLPVTSIAWSIWASKGMGGDEALMRRLSQSGLMPIDLTDGLSMLSDIIGAAPANISVIPARWQDYLKNYYFGKASPYLSALTGTPNATDERNEEPDFLARVQKLPPAARQKTVQQAILKEIERVMSLDTGVGFDIERPLQELGLDSLMAIDIRNGLGRLLGSTLPTAILYKHPSVAELTAFIMEDFVKAEEEVMPVSPVAAPVTSHDPGVDLEALEAMSDDEIDALLGALS
jgi:acyl carrier protein